MKLLVLLCFLSSLCIAYSAKILGIFHMPAHSHFTLGSVLLKELAAKGHEVTVINSFPQTKPLKNWKDVPLTGFKNLLEDAKTDFFEDSKRFIFGKIFMLNMIGLHITEMVLNDTNVQKLIKSNEKFDVIIMEQFLNEAFKGFGFRFNAPIILLSTIGPTRWTNPQVGNPAPPSVVPDMFLSFPPKMNFCERVQNFLVYVGAEIFRHIYVFRKHNELIQKYFPGAPHFNELYYNTSLILVNSHVSTNQPVPYVPNMIDIGGYHIKPPQKLPNDLQVFLDSAKDGAIYFSMGGNIKSKDIPVPIREAILTSLSKLKEKVLWKFEEELPGQPSNVKISKWLPQQDVLAHPNIKLFITHGGLLSTIEAIYHGVPVLSIPVFGDQELNAVNAAQNGYGIALPFRDLSEESLTASLKEILTNSKYSDNAKTRSKILHDQPIKPLDKAVFWVQYVIRHKGAPHLRTAALDLNWYQYLLLDVIAFVGAVIIGTFIVLYVIVKKLCCGKKVVITEKKKRR